MSVAKEVFGGSSPASSDKAIGVSVIGTAAAIRAARYHAERATSPGIRAYWVSVIESLERKVSA